MKVLVACEESQAVCIAFREMGHDAFSCDIQECSGGHPEWHICGDVVSLLNGYCAFITQDGKYHKIDNKWDMIIAFPPCTYFTSAGACRMFHKVNGVSQLDTERYEKAMEYKKFFMSILNANCDKISIENPTPLKIVNLPKETQVIQPYMFGHPWTKRTLLWLKGLPDLTPTNIVEPVNGSWVNGGHVAGHKGMVSSKMRSKTFQGVADAMAKQWGCL